MHKCRCIGCDKEYESEHGRNIHESKCEYELDFYWNDKPYLREMYFRRGYSMKQIADKHGATYNRVRDAIKSFGIPTRHANETRYFDQRKQLRRSIDEIKEQYLEENVSMVKLADKYSVDDATIKRLLIEAGVDTRDIQGQHLATSEYQKLNDAEWLRTQYRDKRRYCPEIAKEIGCSTASVMRALHRNNIQVWPHGDTISGEQNYNWKGEKKGGDFFGANWQRIREECISRDGGVCQVCGMSRQEHKDKHNKDISVHHITPRGVFDDIDEANELQNLITLCTRCHRRWEGIPVMPQ